MRKWLASRWVRVAFGLVGAAFLGVAFRRTWDASQGMPLPSWQSALAAVGIVTAGVFAGGRSWSALLEGGGARRLARGFYASQLGKYIPGGIWQPAGQVALAVGPEVSAARAATALPVHVVAQLAAGLAVGGALAVAGAGTPAWLRAAALGGLAALPLLGRGWMLAAASRIRRWRGGAAAAGPMPSQAAILRSFAWAVGSILCAGAAFAVVLGSMGSGDGVAGAVPAFALAWAVGYLAVPFPSGIGVREGVLALALPASPAVVIAASLVYRLAQMGAEVVMIGVAARRR